MDFGWAKSPLIRTPVSIGDCNIVLMAVPVQVLDKKARGVRAEQQDLMALCQAGSSLHHHTRDTSRNP